MKKTKIKKDLFNRIKEIGSENKVRGITLISLVITIIILLILAGVSIAAISNVGLFGKAQEAKEKIQVAQEKENTTLSEYENALNNQFIGTRAIDGAISFKKIQNIEWLKKHSGYINNCSSGTEKIDLTQYGFSKTPYAIISGTRAMTAYVVSVSKNELEFNWYTAWGGSLGNEFGAVWITLFEPQ